MSPEPPQFAIARKGYNTTDVDAFVLLTNEAIEALQTQMAAMQRDLTDAYEETAQLREELHGATAELEKANQELDVTRGQEEALRMTLVSASRTKDEMLATAQLEAENMVAEATTEAKSILGTARQEAARLDEHTQRVSAQIEHQKSQAEAERRSLADSYAAQIADAHQEHLTAIAQLETLYQTMAEQLEAMIDETHRGIAAGMSQLAEAVPKAISSLPVDVASIPPEKADTLEPVTASSPPVEAEEELSAFDRMAQLTPPTAVAAAESIEVTTAPSSDSPPRSPDARETPESIPAPAPQNDVPEPAIASPALSTEIASKPEVMPHDEPTTPPRMIDQVPSDSPSEPSAGVAGAAISEAPVASDDALEATVEAEGGTDAPEETRRSFYDRRSGHLPRLGDDKQQDTSSSMAALRDKS